MMQVRACQGVLLLSPSRSLSSPVTGSAVFGSPRRGVRPSLEGIWGAALTFREKLNSFWPPLLCTSCGDDLPLENAENLGRLLSGQPLPHWLCWGHHRSRNSAHFMKCIMVPEEETDLPGQGGPP